MNTENFDLIVSIVNKNSSENIIKASKRAGAEGGTIIYGRGTGVRETKTLFGIPIEPEKEVVLTIVSQDISDNVLDTIVRDCELDKPGAGIAFMVELKKVAGICHLCQPDFGIEK